MPRETGDHRQLRVDAPLKGEIDGGRRKIESGRRPFQQFHVDGEDARRRSRSGPRGEMQPRQTTYLGHRGPPDRDSFAHADTQTATRAPLLAWDHEQGARRRLGRSFAGSGAMLDAR
ncbi:hypothetical protein [Methylobacterium hispanicum]|uniref:hypothetical protein n=1 Tax=Methylobacterium hispanicum TaxID=270350 RepID=UPI001EDDB0BA|nr:hypothetical protein [Methylobacterium hispanicum]